jgi:hypothetical protein
VNATPGHLIVVSGPQQGREIVVPSQGARFGRASNNELVFPDATMSTYHGRFFFKDDGTLWITDFGSTNETLVNGEAVTERPLALGDVVRVGETMLRVIAGPAGAPRPPGAPPPVDLGFGESSEPARSGGFRRAVRMLAALVAVAALALAALRWGGAFFRTVPSAPPEAPRTFQLRYEKVEGSADNIFRYALRLEDGRVSVEVDDLKNGRRVTREGEADAGALEALVERIEDSGFFALEEDLVGQSEGAYDLWDLTAIVGRRASRTRVLNRLEPEAFRAAREAVEEFGRNELGLSALALSPERLTDLAQDSFLQGRKLFDERDIRLGNLSAAIQAFAEAQHYLETIEPKPDWYADAVAGERAAAEELETRYQNVLFRAERAIRLRDWSGAARELRAILDLVPGRSDERHRAARVKLLDVERRLER